MMNLVMGEDKDKEGGGQYRYHQTEGGKEGENRMTCCQDLEFCMGK